MLGLANYASSDEEEEPQDEAQMEPKRAEITKAGIKTAESKAEQALAAPDLDSRDEPIAAPYDGGDSVGPTVGPSMPPNDQAGEGVAIATPEPTYTSATEAIRSLTMPPVPNFNIPPSPPGSPPLAATKKVANYLKLKKTGVHFNERLASSSALKNPSLFERLKGHANISDEEQYASTLPEDLAVPVSFPPWAYADELGRSQLKIRARKEAEKKKRPREKIDFVSSGSSMPNSKAARR